MAIKKEIIGGKMQLTHPSGTRSTVKLADLQRHRGVIGQLMECLQLQIRIIDQRIDALQASQGKGG